MGSFGPHKISVRKQKATPKPNGTQRFSSFDSLFFFLRTASPTPSPPFFNPHSLLLQWQPQEFLRLWSSRSKISSHGGAAVMGGGSMAPLVPTVKTEPSAADSTAPPPPPPPLPPPPPPPPEAMAAELEAGELNATASEANSEDLDKDMLCPICMQIIKDAFLTTCGHSFCYMCIVTHLRNKSDCPCCGHFLRSNSIFPNILLDKVRCALLMIDFGILFVDRNLAASGSI